MFNECLLLSQEEKVAALWSEKDELGGALQWIRQQLLTLLTALSCAAVDPEESKAASASSARARSRRRAPTVPEPVLPRPEFTRGVLVDVLAPLSAVRCFRLLLVDVHCALLC